MIKKLLSLLALSVTSAVAQPTITVTQVNNCYYPQAINNVTFQVSNNTSANSFSWTCVGPNCNDSLLSASGYMSVFNIKCCGTHTVYCSGYVNGNLNWTMPWYFSLNCPPVVNISASNQTACIGMGGTLTAYAPGATSYTWNPGTLSGATAVVYPLTNTCYTAVATDMNGCLGSAVSCFSVLPLPQLSVSTGTFCLGSSVTYTASGAVNYGWSNGISGSTTQVLVTTPSTVGVVGTDINGCTNTFTFNVVPDTTCAFVWPGDANSDGTVNSSDILELGLYANQTGSPRNPGGNSYNAQFATAWTGTGSNNQNRSHIDCNGDGTVNANDTVAIVSNYGLNHSFRSSLNSGAAGDITLIAPAYVPNDGSWAKIDIMLGSSGNMMSNIYGIAF
jgi:hypothetical protein